MLGGLDEFRHSPVNLCGPLCHALPQEPHAVDVLVKTNAATDGAQVGEVRCLRIWSVDRLLQECSHQRPGSRADVGPVVSAIGNSSDCRCRVVTGGRDQIYPFQGTEFQMASG